MPEHPRLGRRGPPHDQDYRQGDGFERSGVRIKAEDFLARVLQHEIDHLDGILFVDRMDDGAELQPDTDDEDVEAVTA